MIPKVFAMPLARASGVNLWTAPGSGVSTIRALRYGKTYMFMCIAGTSASVQYTGIDLRR